MSRMSRNTPVTLEATQKAHIDELVTLNRSLEAKIKTLKDDLEAEKANLRHSLAEAQVKYQDEQAEWRQGVRALQSCYNVAQLRVLLDLDGERLNVLKEQDNTRREKLARIQRDYRLVMFTDKEASLMRQISELQAEVDAVANKAEEREHKFTKRNVESLATIQEFKRDLMEKEKENDRLSQQLAEQLEETARQKANYETLLPRLERSNLIQDGATAKQTELQREVDDLKRAKAEVDRQLDKWREFETRGSEDMENERKKRIRLEAEVVALRSSSEKEKEKSELRISKLKVAVKEWTAHATSLREDLEEEQRKVAETKEDNAALYKKVEKLKAMLAEERHKVTSSQSPAKATSPLAGPSRAPSPPKPAPKPASRRAEVEVTDIEEVERPRPVPKKRVRKKQEKTPDNSDIEEIVPKAKSKGKGKQKVSNEEAEDSDAEVREVATKSKVAKGKRKALPEEEESSEIEEVKTTKAKVGKGKGRQVEEEEAKDTEIEEVKAKSKTAKGKKAQEQMESEIEEVAKEPKGKGKEKEKAATKRKGKAKATEESEAEVDVGEKKGKKGKGKAIEESDIEVTAKPKGGKRAREDSVEEVTPVPAPAPRPRGRPSNKPPSASTAMASRATSRQPLSRTASTVGQDSGTDEPNKKRRKINIFGTTPTEINFGQGGMSTLGIPTVLSPVKESDAPSRSTSGILSRLFSGAK